jgi:hypothetical protein
MQISKLYLVVCAAAFCANITAVRADDNPAQAAALAAMTQKMNELSAQQPQQAQSPAITVTPSGATVLETANPSAPMTPAPAQTTMSSASSGNSLFAPVPPSSGGVPPGAALEQGTPSSTAQTPMPTGVQPSGMGSSQPFNASTAGQQLGLPPIVAPPLPISAAQQQQLQALLAKYDANTITPEQYQTERAKILAEHKQK